MHVMQQSSKAHDRSLGDWFVYIEKGMIKLPRFQRMEACNRGLAKRAMLPVGWAPRASGQCPPKNETVGV